MCGIVGFTYRPSEASNKDILIKMRDTLVHRGPNESGIFMNEYLALGHRRLSIIDLVSGRQPMLTCDDDVVVSYNGEIYNFPELKRELQKEYRFTTNSDTEVLLYAYKKWDMACLNKLNGMFAFALYDKAKQKVILARDRMGQKPLYYGTDKKKNLYFASEPKALFQHPHLDKQISQQGLASYLKLEYIPAPLTIYQDVYKLNGGEYIVFDLISQELTRGAYWERTFSDDRYDETDIKTRLITLLLESIERRLISDVPLGVFLSGGIDSSAITAMMCKQRDPQKIKTFSISFPDKSFDESYYARLISKKFGTDHYEQALSPGTLIDILPEILEKLDEPFADASLIPTYLLCKFAKEQITVALSGDGADELFAGYPTFLPYKLLKNLWIPPTINRLLKTMADYMPVDDRNISLDFVIKQTLKGLSYRSYERMNTWMGSFCDEELSQLLVVYVEAERLKNDDAFMNIYDYYQKTYLQEDILTKVDRASMMNSLEVRSPFLDVHLVEFVNNLHESYKLRGTTMKYILKHALKKYLPQEIVCRSKKGFGVPVAKWFKKELKGELLAALNKGTITKQGLFQWPFIKDLLNGLFSNKKDTRKQLWALYIFQKWYEKEFSS